MGFNDNPWLSGIGKGGGRGLTPPPAPPPPATPPPAPLPPTPTYTDPVTGAVTGGMPQRPPRRPLPTDLNTGVQDALTDYGDVAWGLNDVEERRGADMEQYLRRAAMAADKPTITQQEIDRRFGQKSDEASRTFLGNMGGLRDYVGASGITGGGHIGGIAANAELQRLQQLTTARGDLMSFKATSDALDRQRMFDRAKTVGEAINRPVSMLGVDFENAQLQTRLSQLGIEAQRQGMQAQADASKPGFLDFLGPIAGIIGSLI